MIPISVYALRLIIPMSKYPYLTPGNPLSKRIFDILISSLAMILLSPLFLILALLIKTQLGSPILFHQTRPGYSGKLFRIHKFRTMNHKTDSEGNLLPDSQRLTRLGKFMRATSLDELPELINVLFGEMSLVGPRPLLTAYLDRYSPEQMRRHEMRPGITGWAQIHGRNALEWQQRFKMDVWYVDNWTFWLDLKILALTVWKVLCREGINQPGQATTQEFMGNPPAISEDR